MSKHDLLADNNIDLTHVPADVMSRTTNHLRYSEVVERIEFLVNNQQCTSDVTIKVKYPGKGQWDLYWSTESGGHVYPGPRIANMDLDFGTFQALVGLAGSDLLPNHFISIVQWGSSEVRNVVGVRLVPEHEVDAGGPLSHIVPTHVFLETERSNLFVEIEQQ